METKKLVSRYRGEEKPLAKVVLCTETLSFCPEVGLVQKLEEFSCAVTQGLYV